MTVERKESIEACRLEKRASRKRAKARRDLRIRVQRLQPVQEWREMRGDEERDGRRVCRYDGGWVRVARRLSS